MSLCFCLKSRTFGRVESEFSPFLIKYFINYLIIQQIIDEKRAKGVLQERDDCDRYDNRYGNNRRNRDNRFDDRRRRRSRSRFVTNNLHIYFNTYSEL